MKKLALFIAGLHLSLSLAQPSQGFKPLRYDEDFSRLKNDTAKSGYKKLKFTALNKSGNAYVSFGGDLRLQYFQFRNEDWGDTPDDRDGYVLSRYLAHADFHAGRSFRIFLQLQGSTAPGRVNPNAIESNPLDWHQAFFDFVVPTVTLRVGRQELSYGSQRLVSFRESPNSRSAFDGIKIIRKKGNLQSDLFYMYPVVNQNGIFDDHFQHKSMLWGSYTVFNKAAFLQNLDVYYLGLRSRKAVFDDAAGTELRHSVGMRIWESKNAWQYDLEGVYQFGTLENQKIAAWTVSSNLSYAFRNTRYKPVIGLKTEAISGNKTYGDQTLETFNALFPKGAYFGLAAFIGPSNLMDVHPWASFEVAKNTIVTLDCDAFWRFSTNDGIYAANTHLIYSGKSSGAKYIGTQFGIEAACQYTDFVFFKLQATWFQSGAFLKDSGTGSNILMGGITAQLKF